jgi:hypothetical protein
VSPRRSIRWRKAHEVLPGDEVWVENGWAQVDAARVYDGWVSLTVPGMELRLHETELVWSR